MGKKRKLASKDDEFQYDPIPKHLVTSHIKKQEKRLIIILEKAQLETVKVSNTHIVSKETVLFYKVKIKISMLTDRK